MREIAAAKITEVVKKLCIEANCHLPQDMKDRIQESYKMESWPQAKEILERIIENYQIADEKTQPICQDTGMACVFVKIGLEVHAPFSLNSSWADGYMEMITRTGTKYFGFIPDMGIFCKNIPDVVREKFLRQGAKEECLKIVDDCYAERVAKGFVKIKYDLNLGKANMEYRMANGMAEMMEAVKKAGGGPADLGYAGSSFTYSWSDPQDLIDNIDYIFHTHAKCYNTSADYVETATAIPEVVAAAEFAGAKWLVVEQDAPSMGLDPLGCAEKSITYLKSL